MILSAVFSKPSKTCPEIFGKPYIKIRIWKNPSPSAKKQNEFQAEFFTEKQAFQKVSLQSKRGNLLKSTQEQLLKIAL